MPYDLLISYSRKDNVNNRVTELKNQIEKDYFEFYRESLGFFSTSKKSSDGKIRYSSDDSQESEDYRKI